MSNIVKYPFVNLQGKDARKVSYEKPGAFTPMEHKQKVVVRDAAEVEAELAKGLSIEEIFQVNKSVVKIGGDEEEPEFEEEDDGFEEGIPAVDITADLKEKMEAAQAEADEIIESAREQADQIVIDARSQADDVRAQAHEEGFEAGREEGIQAGNEEVSRIREEIESRRTQLEQEYENLVAELEPKFVRVMCDLMEKLTGVVIEEQQDLIMHLIKAGMEDVRKTAERIIVRISPEDAPTVEQRKKELLELVPESVTIDIMPQDGMEKNDCIIETDNQMLDAGIHTQLEDMLMAIRMLT